MMTTPCGPFRSIRVPTPTATTTSCLKKKKKMSMLNDEPRLPEFTGKHTRFIYNSDDEMVREKEAMGGAAVSPSVLVLKGLPRPQGKHLRFQEEDEYGFQVIASPTPAGNRSEEQHDPRLPKLWLGPTGVFPIRHPPLANGVLFVL
ncbi:hypothetical protein C4D60_Mb02t11170 [Musa balbisiana]|uniref:Uncharacterized protein n=1 Tax=Musa balbisiana TaxID=52838 RepID=A0A4S8IAQ6_MUSBA|nr:hypothetical protein C4D60_Mb02t11170 [Musa balbisiana]